MSVIHDQRKLALVIAAAGFWLLWVFSYVVWPRVSFDDGPFYAEPYGADIAALSTLSSTDLMFMGTTVFFLETRELRLPDPRTMFVLKRRDGSVRWAMAAPAEFGRIALTEGSTHWLPPGGWVIGIKPQRTECGLLYLSPFGEFRFFFHSW